MTRVWIVLLGAIAAGSADGQIEPSGRDAAAPASVADRAALYARVATADRATLETLARTAAAEPADPDNRFMLDAVLRRYLEIDPGQALRFARELKVTARAVGLLGPLYEAWARIDRDAALDAVGRLDDPVESRAAALAVLRAFGDQGGAVERVAGVVRGVDSNAFRVDAIALRAESYPLTALREALAFSDPATRKSAAERALAFSATSAPRDALAIIDGIGDPDLKSALQIILLKNWDARDVDGMLTYLRRVDPTTRNEAMRTMPMQIARADPERAIELVEQLPLGQERQQMLTFIAREYARKSPEDALAWARRLDPPQPDVIGAVFDGLALTDPLRAFDLALTIEPAAARTSALQSAVQHEGRNGSEAAALAEKVLALDDGQEKDAMLETLVGNWSVRSLREAADWLVAHGDRVSPQTLLTLGQRFAERDPDGTATYLDRVPATARGIWIAAIAERYARSDPQRAMSFVAQFGGDPANQSAGAAVAREIAAYDPPAAAKILDGLDMTVPALPTRLTAQQADVQGAAMMTAQQWARVDPHAAAAWALGLRDERARIGPLFAVSRVWASTDPRGVRDWILGLPIRADRDTALRGLVAFSDPAILDAVLINAFSSAEMMQRVLSGYAGLFARKNPQAARRVVDQYVTDPTMRAAAERQIEVAANRPFPPWGRARGPHLTHADGQPFRRTATRPLAVAQSFAEGAS